MKEYIIMIAGAAVLSVLGDIMSPESWKKYIRIITGLVIVSVIMSPLAKFKSIDLLSDLSFEQTGSADIEDYSGKWVMNEFERTVCEDIKDRVKRDYGKECEVRVTLKVNDREQIESVERIDIYMAFPPETLKQKMNDMYGVEMSQVILHG